MLRPPFLVVVILVASAVAARARVVERHATELTALLDRVVTQQRQGGWLFPSLDGGRPEPYTYLVRWAERLAAPLGLARWDVIVVRSPGTPAAGLVLLQGHRLTGRAEYLAAARRAGDLLVATQLASGGWFSEMPVVDGRLPVWFSALERRTTLDDDVTPGAIRFLLALWEATREPRYRTAAEHGLALLLAAQLPSGAWPLVVRPRWEHAIVDSYEDYGTLNDGATTAAIETLLVAARALGRDDLLASAQRGGAWLLRVCGAPPQAGWAAQYDRQDRPAAARPFEPPALASWESRYALDALSALAVATGDPRWCAPVADAVAWLERSALRPGCWARFYELGTNAPIYVASDRTRVTDRVHARPGYSWTGDFGIPAMFARLGVGSRVAPPSPLAGDPGTCAGGPVLRPHGSDVVDPRALIARAGVLLAARAPPPRDPCRLGQ